MAMTLANSSFCLKGSLRRYLNRSFNTDAKHYYPVKGDRGVPFFIFSIKKSIFTVLVVVLAMSGGVDSSVTAKLLADQVSKSPNA